MRDIVVATSDAAASRWPRRTPTWPRPRSSCRTARTASGCWRGAGRGRRGYPYVLVDCPPSLGMLTLNALAAADRLIVPVQCEYYALEGLAQLLETVELIRARVNPRLRLTGLLLTMHDGRTRLSSDVAREVRSHFGPKVFSSVSRARCGIAEAPSHGRPISTYDPRSPAPRRTTALRWRSSSVASQPRGRRARAGPRAGRDARPVRGDAAYVQLPVDRIEPNPRQPRRRSTRGAGGAGALHRGRRRRAAHRRARAGPTGATS